MAKKLTIVTIGLLLGLLTVTNTQHVTRFENLNGEQGYMGIYEAPEPWGPWSTILFVFWR